MYARNGKCKNKKKAKKVTDEKCVLSDDKNANRAHGSGCVIVV